MQVPAASEPFLITDPSGIEAIEDEWRALAVARSNAFLTPDWVRSWWEHRGHHDGSLLIVGVRREGALLGLLPLTLDTAKRPRSIRFAGAALGDRFHPVCEEIHETEVAAAAAVHLEREGKLAVVMRLEQIEPGCPWLEAMREAPRKTLKETDQPPVPLPYIPLQGLDWDGYLAGRSRNFRSQIRRRERALRNKHGMTSRMATEETLDADLDELFRLHGLRWRDREYSPLLEPDAQAILRSFCAAAMGHGWLRLHVAEIEGRAIGALLAWQIGTTYAFYNSGFDPAYSKQSVGRVLVALALQEALEEDATEFDMLLGSEDYKRSFTDEARTGGTVVLTRPGHPVSLLVVAEAKARELRQSLPRIPGLGAATDKLRRSMPTTRS
jgi:CelD/BcsL family acetyltransferase involved in cellulose biosynthesis